MSNAAINGLCLDDRILSCATTGFQVVSIHQHCPQHFGLFFDADLASAHATNCNSLAKANGSPEKFKVKAWKKRNAKTKA